MFTINGIHVTASPNTYYISISIKVDGIAKNI